MRLLNKKNSVYIFFVLLLAGVGLYFLLREGTIPDDKFRDIYIDLVLAQDSMGNDINSTHKILSRLFIKYDVDSVEYDNTLKDYSKDIQKWNDFFDKVIMEMEARNSTADSVSRKGIDN